MANCKHTVLDSTGKESELYNKLFEELQDGDKALEAYMAEQSAITRYQAVMDDEAIKKLLAKHTKAKPSIDIARINDVLVNETATWETNDSSDVYTRKDKATGALTRLGTHIRETYMDPVKDGKSWQERKADRKFDKLDKDKDTITVYQFEKGERKAMKLTYPEYIKFLNEGQRRAIGKGKYIHKRLEYASFLFKYQQEAATSGSPTITPDQQKHLMDIYNEQQAILKEYDLYKHYNSTQDKLTTQTAKTILEYVKGDGIPEIKVEQLLTIDEEDLQVGTTIDLLTIDKFTGTTYIFDYKTSNLDNPRYQSFFKYTADGEPIISDKSMISQLELTERMLMMKHKFPELNFGGLYLVQIRSGARETYIPVDLDTNLKLLESFFKAKHPKFYAKNPHLFKVETYTTIDKNVVAEDLKDSRIASMFDELDQLQGVMGDLSNLTYGEVGAKIKKLINDITLQLEGKQVSAESSSKDMSWIQRMFGNLYDVQHPLVQSFAKFFYARKTTAENVYTRLAEDYKKEVELLSKAKGTTDHKKLFGNLLITDENDKRRLIVRGSKEFDTLSEAEKRFSDYYRRAIRFNLFAAEGPKVGLDYVEKELQKFPEDKQLLAHKQALELLPDINKFEKDNLYAFQYEPDWLPSVPPARHESNPASIKKRMADSVLGIFSITEAESLEAKFNERVGKDKGITLQYMFDKDSDEVTEDLDYMFDRFTRSSVKKTYLDDVLLYAQGVKSVMAASMGGKGRDQYKNTIDFITDMVDLHIRDIKKPTKILGRALEFKIQGRIFSIDSVFKSMSKTTSLITLGWKVLAGLRSTGASVFMIKSTGFRNKMAKALGVPPEEIDFSKLGLFGNSDFAVFKAKLQNLSGIEVTGTSKKIMKLMEMTNYHTNFFNLEQKDYVADNKRILFGTVKMPEGSAGAVVKMASKITNPYMAYSIWDDFNTSAMLVGQLKSWVPTLYDDNGNKIDNKKTMWELLDENGNWNSPYNRGNIRGQKLKGLDPLEVAKLRRVSELEIGTMRADERSAIQLYAIGSLFMQMKNFMPGILKKTYSGKNQDWALGKYVDSGKKDKEGIPILEWQARETVGEIMGLFRFLQKRDWSKMTPAEKKAAFEGSYKLALFAAAVPLLLMMLGFDDDDDDWLSRNMHAIAGDLSWQYNPYAIFRGATSIASVSKMMDLAGALNEVTENTFRYVTDSGQSIVTRGEWKGYLKGTAALTRNLPFSSALRDYDEMLESFEEE